MSETDKEPGETLGDPRETVRGSYEMAAKVREALITAARELGYATSLPCPDEAPQLGWPLTTGNPIFLALRALDALEAENGRLADESQECRRIMKDATRGLERTAREGPGVAELQAMLAAARAGTYTLAEMLRLQGMPEDALDEAPFTMTGKRRLVGNGVPIAMGRAFARAVRYALATPPAAPPPGPAAPSRQGP